MGTILMDMGYGGVSVCYIYNKYNFDPKRERTFPIVVDKGSVPIVLSLSAIDKNFRNDKSFMNKRLQTTHTDYQVKIDLR